MANNTSKRVNIIWKIIHMKHVIIKYWKGKNLKQKLLLSSSASASSPSGFFAVYIGSEAQKRFMVPIRFLTLPIFVYLLETAKEEYGFKFNGGIVLPCEVGFFEEVLKFLEKDEKKYGRLEVNEFLRLVCEADFEAFDSFCCKDSYLSLQHQSFMPLLHKTTRV